MSKDFILKNSCSENLLEIIIKASVHIIKNFWWKYNKYESCKSYLGNKEQKAMFLVVSRLYVHFSFAHLFFACPSGRTSEIARPKNQARWSKFVQPWFCVLNLCTTLVMLCVCQRNDGKTKKEWKKKNKCQWGKVSKTWMKKLGTLLKDGINEEKDIKT